MAVCKAINKISNINAKIKWPNDIVVNNKKISGILIETKIKKTKIIYNIGVGINVNLDIHELDPELKDNMSSLFIESKQIQRRELLLSEFMKSLKTAIDDNDIINSWIAHCSHMNNKIFFHSGDVKIDGTFMGINSDGLAIIKFNNKLNYYSSGIVEL